MSQIPYRGNLSSPIFPLVSEWQGQTVIIKGSDAAEHNDPQLYYAHNVMPTSEGYQSVGYIDKVTDFKAYFKDVITLQSAEGVLVDFSHATSGANYVRRTGEYWWTQINSVAGAGNVVVTSAAINGQSYIFFANVGCYMYEPASNTLVPIPLLGLDVTQVLGISDSNGYMVAWTNTSVAWSSAVGHPIPTDPIDFVPSLATGAGGGGVEQARGPITLCQSAKAGIVIYTTRNAVAMVYSGNVRFPFNFREITATGGLEDQSLVSTDAISDNQYAYTTSGLQLVGLSGSQTVFPQITDFLGTRFFEDFDPATGIMNTVEVLGTLAKALTVIADRYLVVSYGLTSDFTHALVADLVLKRFGKLKINHVSCFEYGSLDSHIQGSPKETIAFLQSNGSVKVVDFSYTSQAQDGVMILGKYQITRSRLITMHEIDLENIRFSELFTLYTGASMDGKNISGWVRAEPRIVDTNFIRYNCRTTGINVSLLCVGGFYMSSLELKMTVNGRR